MRDDPSATALVARVDDGEQEAWNEPIERYAPLAWSIRARFRLRRHHIDGVGQSVWLLPPEPTGNLREPAALVGWLGDNGQT
jgi:hypothetical protein